MDERGARKKMRQRGLYAAQVAGSGAGSTGRRRMLYAQEPEREGSGGGGRGSGRVRWHAKGREMTSGERSVKIPSEGSRMTRGMDKRGR